MRKGNRQVNFLKSKITFPEISKATETFQNVMFWPLCT